MMDAYAEFLARKAIVDPPSGMDLIPELPVCLLPLQAALVPWALRRGRAALFAGTGLGKSLMELAWGQAVWEATGEDVIHFAPLAVTAQLVREAEKFGIPAYLTGCEKDRGTGIPITNYQKLRQFDLSRRSAVILDESSILKSTDGHYRTELIDACQSIPFRLAATATPAPNDFVELGNHAEFLGILSQTDMLATFFTHDSADTRTWRLKGHAEEEFWRWMASWAVMLRKPSDLGFSDDGYELPPLEYVEHILPTDLADAWRAGVMLPMQAETLAERIAARRATVDARCAHAASLTPPDRPFVWWCNLNAESERLAALIPGAVETKGSDSDEVKERKLRDFSEGRIRVLVTKAGVAGFGMNWQHCADTGFVGLNDSFEQFYQAVRRFWRFGQTRPVRVHIVTADTEGAVLANIRRKEADAERMAEAMVRHMADLSSAAVRGAARDVPLYRPVSPIQLPRFLEAA